LPPEPIPPVKDRTRGRSDDGRRPARQPPQDRRVAANRALPFPHTTEHGPQMLDTRWNHRMIRMNEASARHGKAQPTAMLTNRISTTRSMQPATHPSKMVSFVSVPVRRHPRHCCLRGNAYHFGSHERSEPTPSLPAHCGHYSYLYRRNHRETHGYLVVDDSKRSRCVLMIVWSCRVGARLSP